LLAEGAVSGWRFGSGSSDGVRVLVMVLQPLGPAHHHIGLLAATLAADQPLAPIEHSRFGAAPRTDLGGSGSTDSNF
jgi:hypothetical protein